MSTNKEYLKVLEKKAKSYTVSGFTVDESELNPLLFPFQKFIVQRALLAGKYAIFADCGLGKTFMQLEWARNVVKQTGLDVLILAPFAVVSQTIEEGARFGIEVRDWSEMGKTTDEGIFIANYEQLENINCSLLGGVVIDESSILKNFEGATKQLIIETFSKTDYKLACTATPSPNDPMELGNHSEFLDVMGRNEMLAMYFVHDGGETAKWRLKKHSVESFYQFVGTWAIMLSKPQDIGFEMKGYDLPKLNFFERQVITEKRNNGKLYNDVSIDATSFNGELKLTVVERLQQVVDIVNNSTEQFIVWIRHDEEGEILRKLIPDAIEVKGSDKPDFKKKHLLGFAKNEFRVLITKTKIAQYGLNYQNCHNQVFAALDFSFEGLYQSIRRSYRFGQNNEVNIYIVTVDTMQNVIESIRRKEKEFEKMQLEMAKAVNINLSHNTKMIELVNSDRHVKNEYFEARRGDCVQLIQDLENESIDFSVFSPPFAELYTYSSHIEDMGNSKDYKEFLEQFGFLVKELYRVIKQGRNVAVHCMDLPIQKGKEGFIGLRDFSGMILRAFEESGFIYHSRVTIWKDPVVEMQRTKALGLLHKQVKKDSTMSRVGIPDYILIFRKDGVRDNPVRCDINVDTWQKYASPVWMDINYSDTLQGYMNARDEKDEKHICPLQLPTVERLIHLYTNPGDTVLEPFGGIGTTAYKAVQMDRKAKIYELKESYFDMLVKNCMAAVEQKKQLQLF